jgi:hypothetical protein
MSTGNDNRIETLVREKLEGKSYSTIREELAGSGMSNEEITKLIRLVDEQVLSETLKEGNRGKVQQWYRIGLILAIFGLVLSIAFNAGIILKGIPPLLAYSPFLAGILIMLYARALQRKHSDPPDTGTGAIRKRRPYK